VDGRSDFYGPEIGNQFLEVMRGLPGWEKVLEKYRFNLVLIPADIAAAQLLKQRPEWRVEATTANTSFSCCASHRRVAELRF